MEFITDRTVRDVQLAQAAILAKIQKGLSPTEKELGYLLRGTLTIDVLNRLEAEIRDLSNTLISEFYFVNVEPKEEEWGYKDIFDSGDHDRFLKNVDAFRAFYKGDDMPTTPTYMYSWQNMNAIESILKKIYEIVTQMEANTQYCGTFYCGDENNL